MELQDPRNRKMQNLIAFSVSAGIHLTGLLALLSIDACSKDSPDEVVATAGMPLEIPEIKEVNEVQKRNRHRERTVSGGSSELRLGEMQILQEGQGRETTNLVVRAGDTLWTIARKCKTTPAKLAKMNGTDVKALSVLRVGQVLKVPVQ